MASGTAGREEYREYAHYLRSTADQPYLSVTPGEMERLRKQVRSERWKFLLWEAIWLLLAFACGTPIFMGLAVQWGLPLPALWAQSAQELHQGVEAGRAGATTVMLVSGSLFAAAALIAYVPLMMYGRAMSDLDHAHRLLKSS